MNEREEISKSGLIVTIFLKIHGILCPWIDLKKKRKRKNVSKMVRNYLKQRQTLEAMFCNYKEKQIIFADVNLT